MLLLDGFSVGDLITLRFMLDGILGEASETLVFDQQGFVVGLLERAKIVGAAVIFAFRSKFIVQQRRL